MRAAPGMVVILYQVDGLFDKDYARATTIQTAVFEFSKTEIYPNNRHIFGLAADAQTTERGPAELAKPNEVEEVPSYSYSSVYIHFRILAIIVAMIMLFVAAAESSGRYCIFKDVS